MVSKFCSRSPDRVRLKMVRYFSASSWGMPTSEREKAEITSPWLFT